MIYIRTYVHMCILLSEKHGSANWGGRFRDCANLVGAQSFRESVTYIKYVYPAREKERDIYIYKYI